MKPIGVMLSVQPRWSRLILSGEKTAELRKTFPKAEKIATPFRCFIYETMGPTETPWTDEDGHMIFRGRGAVVGSFICPSAELVESCPQGLCFCFPKNTLGRARPIEDYCLTVQEARDYIGGKPGYGWRISDLHVYKTPIPLSAFGLHGAPQSWGYVYTAPEIT